MAEVNHNGLVLHIRFEGRSTDIPLADLDVGRVSSDREVKNAVARYLDVTVEKFAHYVVDRHETGNLTIRPEAVFG
jgi:hypothetical protein